MLGARVDPVFGPVVTFGFGGIFAEVLDDVVMRVAPVDYREAQLMIGQSKTAKLLVGARGGPSMDVHAVAQILEKLSNLVVALQDDLIELDINPLIVLPEGQGAYAVDALVVLKT